MTDPRKWPPVHPAVHDGIESERCPRCGTPGQCIRKQWPPAQVLDHAISQGWLTLSKDGLRVSPGAVTP